MSDGNNLIGDDTGCADNDFSAGTKNDQVGTGASPIDPLLLAISPADGGDPANGEETGAHTPEDDSPAVDAVDAAITPAPADDQHGNSRPAGDAADIGSIELGADGSGCSLITGAASSGPSALFLMLGVAAAALGSRRLRR